MEILFNCRWCGRASSQIRRACCAWALGVLALVVFTAKIALSAEKPPSPAEQESFLAEARRVALDYDKSLPDFLCKLTIRRYATGLRSGALGRGPSAQEALSDTVTVNLSYYRGEEQYTVLAVNGRPVATTYGGLDGLMSTGEFGMVLRNIFEKPAGFAFVKWTSFHSRNAAVYSYKVDSSARPYELRAWDARQNAFRSAVVSLRGELCIDPETPSVLRLSYQADDVPRGFPLAGASTTVEYNYAEIAHRRYLLPSTAVVRISGDQDNKRNEVSFDSYRKFSSDTNIKFGEEPEVRQ
jgi:hypothetical protein